MPSILHHVLLTAAFLLAAIGAKGVTVLPSTTAEELLFDQVSCTVCMKSVEWLWDEGLRLRRFCRAHDVGMLGSTCFNGGVQPQAMRAVVEDFCETVSTRNAALWLHPETNVFSIVASVAPLLQEDAALERAVQAACRRWLVDAHGKAQLSDVIHANVEMKGEGSVVSIPYHLGKSFCEAPCGWHLDHHQRTFRPEHSH